MSQVVTLEKNKPISKPKWLKVKLPNGEKYKELRNLVDKYELHTICSSTNILKHFSFKYNSRI